MMINKRLIAAVPNSKAAVAKTVAWQWLGLVCNIAMIFALAILVQHYAIGVFVPALTRVMLSICAVSIAVRYLCTVQAGKTAFAATKAVKQTLRTLLFEKLLRLGPAYRNSMETSAVVQVIAEGVDQLETYFGAYLPQFFYSMLAPITLFVAIAPISLRAAVALFVCVPLIPVAIAAVQTFAKKLLRKYWGQYTALGDTFLENLQGLTTLKIYQSDAHAHAKMNQEAETFRKITMRVLTMQLNSIIIMDIVAFGGAALGLVLAVSGYRAGDISLYGCLAIILLSAEFFIPMRQLGSFFHIAMNGMAATDKIFALLDLPEPPQTQAPTLTDFTVQCEGLSFAYEAERPILQGVNATVPHGKLTALVGESGCGKSTLAGLLCGKNKGYTGSLTIGGTSVAQMPHAALQQMVTYLGFQSWVFGGTVAENLRMAAPNATDEALWDVLAQVNLAAFFQESEGLQTNLDTQGTNLSGGQRQRLCLARALLHDTPVYVFDEATSNIDPESESDIMQVITRLAKTKTVLVITHRLANIANADTIYAMEQGALAGCGTHNTLLETCAAYRALWTRQQTLENFAKGGAAHA